MIYLYCYLASSVVVIGWFLWMANKAQLVDENERPIVEDEDNMKFYHYCHGKKYYYDGKLYKVTNDEDTK